MITFAITPACPVGPVANKGGRQEARRPWHKLTSESFSKAFHPKPPNSDSDVAKLLEGFNSAFTTALDATIPFKNHGPSQRRPSAPWYTPYLKVEKSRCRIIERSWRRKKKPQDRDLYLVSIPSEYKNC